jgi:hypothetical protein
MASWGKNNRKQEASKLCADCGQPLNGSTHTSSDSSSFYATGVIAPICQDCFDYLNEMGD